MLGQKGYFFRNKYVVSLIFIPIHVGECLITRLLSRPLVSGEVTTSRASVRKFITIILVWGGERNQLTALLKKKKNQQVNK